MDESIFERKMLEKYLPTRTGNWFLWNRGKF